MSMNTQQEAEIEADDLLTEIMLRLPLYAIHRFKLLCKQWHSLITSSGFRKLWRKRNCLILQQLYPCRRVYLPLSSNISRTIPSNFEIEKSCNGLLLLHSSGPEYHVYNPTTNKYRTLPKLNCSTYERYLAYDSTRSPYYKVITAGLNVNQIYIYSSRTHYWTSIIESKFPRHYYGGIYWNGSIIWMMEMMDLLYFNIEDQTLKPMPAPPGPAWRYSDNLGESRGRLNCFRAGSTTPCFIDVYELKRDYSRWVLKYRVFNDYLRCRVLSVVHGLEEDDSFLVLEKREKIVRYNLVSKTYEELHVLTAGTDYLKAFQYFESQCDV